MKINTIFSIVLLFTLPLTVNAEGKSIAGTPYGSSEYYTWPDLGDMEEFKVAFDFNFNDPEGIQRALYPVSFIVKTIQEHGPLSFDPNVVVISRGSEVVAWAKKNYSRYKKLVDHAARLADLGVKFEVCVIAADALGFKPDDFHGFVRVVPQGTYSLIYHAKKGYAILPGAATVPAPIINANNRGYLGKQHMLTTSRASD